MISGALAVLLTAILQYAPQLGSSLQPSARRSSKVGGFVADISSRRLLLSPETNASFQ